MKKSFIWSLLIFILFWAFACGGDEQADKPQTEKAEETPQVTEQPANVSKPKKTQKKTTSTKEKKESGGFKVKGGTTSTESQKSTTAEKKPELAGRSSGDIQRQIEKQEKAIQFCFQQAKQKNPKLKGEVKIEFTIAISGEVKNTRVVRTTLNNAVVERCIVQKISRLKFGQASKDEGDKTHSQTFSFG